MTTARAEKTVYAVGKVLGLIKVTLAIDRFAIHGDTTKAAAPTSTIKTFPSSGEINPAIRLL